MTGLEPAWAKLVGAGAALEIIQTGEHEYQRTALSPVRVRYAVGALSEDVHVWLDDLAGFLAAVRSIHEALQGSAVAGDTYGDFSLRLVMQPPSQVKVEVHRGNRRGGDHAEFDLNFAFVVDQSYLPGFAETLAKSTLTVV